jgi:hypothetical protein
MRARKKEQNASRFIRIRGDQKEREREREKKVSGCEKSN